jgi:hypothetical protein
MKGGARMSLNQELMARYKAETGKEATYRANASTYHTLKYVDWLEERAAKAAESVPTSTNTGMAGAEPPQIKPCSRKDDCACIRIEGSCRGTACGVYDPA